MAAKAYPRSRGQPGRVAGCSCAGIGIRVTKDLVNRMLLEMVSFNIYKAKTQLSKLIRQVRAGEEVIIADAGIPVAKLVPIEPPKTARVLGADRGKIWTAPDAFEPLTGEDLATWDGVLFPESRAPTQRPPKSVRPRRKPHR
jgi:prevent-host-death family protein